MIGKARLFRLHKGVGVSAAAFLMVQAITGSILVFGTELATLIDPRGMASRPGSGDARPGLIIAAAEATYPGYRLDRLVFPPSRDGTYFVHLRNEHGATRYVSLDRHDGEVLRHGGIGRFPMVAAFNVHDQWLAGRAGMVLVTASGLAIIVLVISGVMFWWPRRSPLKSLCVRWDAKPRVLVRQLHRTSGVVMAPLLLFVTVTGLTIVIPMVLEPATTAWTSTVSFAEPAEQALAVARRSYPNHMIRDVRVNGPSKISVFFYAPERNSRAVHRVTVNPYKHHPEAVLDASANRAVWIITYPLHTGEFLGIAGRLMTFLLAVALAATSIAGISMWLQTRKAKARSALGRTLKRTNALPQPKL